MNVVITRHSSCHTFTHIPLLPYPLTDPSWSRSDSIMEEREIGGFSLALLDESRYRQIYHELLRGSQSQTDERVETKDEGIRGLAHRILHDHTTAATTTTTTKRTTTTTMTMTTTESTNTHIIDLSKGLVVARVHEIIDAMSFQ